MGKKILVIDESPLIQDYLKQKLEAFSFEVVTAQNGFDANLKVRNELPDLIIMDYFLSRVSSTELLANKMEDPNARSIPVIMLANQLTRERVLELARFKIRKFFSKPIKIDSMVKAISELLGVELKIDETPCMVDVHFNDGILFVEVARGLNAEKIDLLPYKIKEILRLYDVMVPKVLIMMTDITLEPEESGKMASFLGAVKDTTGTPFRGIKLLTTSPDVKQMLSELGDFSKIEIAENVTKAMDGLLGVKVSDFIEEGMNTVKQDLLQAGQPLRSKEEEIRLDFDGERTEQIEQTEQTESPESLPPDSALNFFHGSRIAVVDDDAVIRTLIKTAFSELECDVQEYENGRVFLESLADHKSWPLLIFLDLLMPEADGFTVMSTMKEKGIEIPIIVLSALSKKETVVRAVKSGVLTYLIKPVKPAEILTKTAEVLKANF